MSGKMGSLQNKFFGFLLIFAVYSKISVQTLTCGNNSFFIQYPFKLLQQGQHLHHKSHHDDQFILKCNGQGLVILDLPSSGEFYVRNIDYFDQKIELYDPKNCLPRRLKNFSLTSSPYLAEVYQNYTFFSCPPESLTSSRNLSVISCLSNSTASILATPLLSMADEIRNLTGCKVIYSLQIPVSQLFQYDYTGFAGDLELAWNVPTWKGDCKGKSSRKQVLTIFIICISTIPLGILGTLFCIGYSLRYLGKMVENDEANIQRPHSSTTRVREMARITLPPAWSRPQPSVPSVAAAEPDEYSFGSSTEIRSVVASGDMSSTEELIIGGSQCISGPNGNACTICLEEYQASERLKLIYKCNHCFHADCLETWLQMNNTCPICRSTVG